jgi:hypothetical protein
MKTKNYLDLYNKYKLKYLKLKKQNQYGGSISEKSKDFAQLQLDRINNIINEIEDLLIKIKTLSEDLSRYTNQINNLMDSLNNYLESNDMPIKINGYPFFDLEELEEGLTKFKNELDIEKLKSKYKLRETIYSIDEKDYEKILDIIIEEFNISQLIDIEKLFTSTILGYNKNYIIGYMVLFRFLIKNQIQLSIINNNISYLTFNSIFTLLNNAFNNEEYIPIMIELINQYIKLNPIKKVIQIRNPPEIEKIYGFNEIQIFGNINEKIDFIDSYDSKNKVIIYKSGIVKDEKKTNFDDLKQIINTLFRIPVFPKK